VKIVYQWRRAIDNGLHHDRFDEVRITSSAKSGVGIKDAWREQAAYSSLKFLIFSKSKDIFIMVVAVKING